MCWFWLVIAELETWVDGSAIIKSPVVYTQLQYDGSFASPILLFETNGVLRTAHTLKIGFVNIAVPRGFIPFPAHD
jgi:hypothetical protein